MAIRQFGETSACHISLEFARYVSRLCVLHKCPSSASHEAVARALSHMVWITSSPDP